MARIVGTPTARCWECGTCALGPACLSGYLDADPLRELDALIEHAAPAHAGSFLFHQGDPFRCISVVRLGTVKTYAVDRQGREQILGFHMPGDVIGFSAIDEGRHPCNAVALDTVAVCRLPFQRTVELAARMPGLQARLFRMMSREIACAARQSCSTNADERLAAFLISMADRMGARGYSSTRWQFTMSRMDIASYLRLAPETLSRLLRRFQAEGLVMIDGREVEVRGRERLQALAAADRVSAIAYLDPASSRAA
jgi:CRP/FNR family transcriptional regulator